MKKIVRKPDGGQTTPEKLEKACKRYPAAKTFDFVMCQDCWFEGLVGHFEEQCPECKANNTRVIVWCTGPGIARMRKKLKLQQGA